MRNFSRLVANEADTCRKYVVPRLQAAGWEEPPRSIHEQCHFTAGRIVVAGRSATRQRRKRADYLLRYTTDVPIAVVEAKADYKSPCDGLQQAKEYAETLGLTFAYATNGEGIVEFDFSSGLESELDTFPSPTDLWRRLRAAHGPTDEAASERFLEPSLSVSGKEPRYYQEIAVNACVGAVLSGKRRALITMATGTGKTFVAFQICWRLWKSGWNSAGAARKPRILYLADRNVLVDDPKDKTFAAFGDARWRIEDGVVQKGREIYFALYQSLAGDSTRPAVYRQYAPDFFDLIIVDECHRGSARADSQWREILNYFEPAYQLGMTATPIRNETKDSYAYFGNPLYTYSLRQGIEDGFLAPYRVHRIVTTWDAAGWRPTKGELDRYGREVPDDEYQTKDFERVVSLKARTEAVARHLTNYLKATNRFAKTIVFCVDQEHASEMRAALNNLNADLVQKYPDYVCRVTSDEGDVGAGHLSRFQELETTTPVILTTSQLLTTGVDAPLVKNIVLVRVIGSLVEFKQIIGRGTRVRDDYDKLFFDILDYTGTATRLFADPDFDGEPAFASEEEIDAAGNVTKSSYSDGQAPPTDLDETETAYGSGVIVDPPNPERRKFYVDGGQVTIAAHLVYELDDAGKQLRVVQLTDYAGEKIRTLYRSVDELRNAWRTSATRTDLLASLAERGIDIDSLAAAAKLPDADPLDLLCHLAFGAAPVSRKERVAQLRRQKKTFFDQYGPEAREILDELLQNYTDHGVSQLALPEALQVPPISGHGNVAEIAARFGGPEKLREAVDRLQSLLYVN